MTFSGVSGEQGDENEAHPKDGRHHVSRPNSTPRDLSSRSTPYRLRVNVRASGAQDPQVQTANKISESKVPWRRSIGTAQKRKRGP